LFTIPPSLLTQKLLIHGHGSTFRGGGGWGGVWQKSSTPFKINNCFPKIKKSSFFYVEIYVM
jgi:hypothetical protein